MSLPTPDAVRRRLQHEAYESAFYEWFAALPESEQRRLKSLGLDQPIRPDRTAAVGTEDDDEEHEVEVVQSVEEQIEEERALARAFGQALRWACEAPDLVQAGRRALLMLHVWQPALVEGLQRQIARELEAEFRKTVGSDDDGGPGLGRLLDWLRQAPSLSAMGARVHAAAYVIVPTAIGARTLASLGSMNQKTRQAWDKMVQDFRDTFDGIRSRAMRGDETRIKCRDAQLAKA